MNHFVSIIMPTYNCGNHIKDAIASVINQTYQHWELIIVDDNSSDDTQRVVNDHLNDKRISYIKHDKNYGAAVARNSGIKLATGQYIAFLDSDDIWNPKKLEIQLQYMETNSINFSCTDYGHILENGSPTGRTIRSWRKVGYNGVLLACPIGNSTVMINISTLGKFYVPDIKKRNDDALWLKVLKFEPFCYGIPQNLMSYRLRTTSLSNRKLTLIKYHWQLYRDIERLSIPRSLFHITAWIAIKLLHLKHITLSH